MTHVCGTVQTGSSCRLPPMWGQLNKQHCADVYALRYWQTVKHLCCICVNFVFFILGDNCTVNKSSPNLFSFSLLLLGDAFFFFFGGTACSQILLSLTTGKLHCLGNLHCCSLATVINCSSGYEGQRYFACTQWPSMKIGRATGNEEKTIKMLCGTLWPCGSRLIIWLPTGVLTLLK